MRALLLWLLLAAATFQALLGDESSEKSSDVNYNGPVVYSNLPPPVLYFPNFPPKPKISNRGSDGDVQDKRIEYVPFPYKDLPLLVYQSDKQPPVHVVEKTPSQESTQDEQSPGEKAEESTVTYATSPAVYQQDYGQNQQQYKNVQSLSSLVGQGVPSNQYAEVSLPSNQQILTEVNPQSQQFVSIGISTIQTDLQSNDVNIQTDKEAQQPASHYQQQNNGNQYKYVTHQASDDQHMIIQIPYPVQNLIQTSDQNGATTMDYSSNQNILQQYQPVQTINSQQYSQQQTTSENIGIQQLSPQLQQQITQMIQQNIKQQQQESLNQQQTAINYQNQPQPSINYQEIQQAYSQGDDAQPFQHVGITIIQQPESASVSAGQQRYNDVGQKQEIPQQQQQYVQPQLQDTSEGNYDVNSQQFVSIGVYPLNIPGNTYSQGTQQYYNLMAPQNNQQHSLNIAENRPLPENINYANIKPMGQNINYASSKPMEQSMNYAVSNELDHNLNSARQKPILAETTVIKNDLSGSGQSNPGVQIISIDLSGIGKQNSEQPRNVFQSPNSPNVVTEVRNPPIYPLNNQQEQRYTHNVNTAQQQEQRYAHNVNVAQQQEQRYAPNVNTAQQQEQRYAQNLNPTKNNYNSQSESNFQQILIQIPHNILSQPQTQASASAQSGRPYTGTAQVGNLFRGPNKIPNSNNAVPFHNGMMHQQYAPSINVQHKEPVRIPYVRGNFNSGQRHNGNPQTGNADGRGRPFASNLQPQRQYPNRPPSNNHRVPPPVRTHENFVAKGQSQQNNRRPAANQNPQFNRGRDLSKMPSNINQDVRKNQQAFGNYRSKPVVRHLGGHPGLYASGSHTRFTSVRPPPSKMPYRSMKKDAPRKASASINHSEYSSNSAESEAALTSPTVMMESTAPPFNFKHKNQFVVSDNITNLLDDINFDEINQFLNSGPDMFGSNSLGQGKKKLEDETFDKLIHKITKDALTNDPLLEFAVAAHPHELINPSPVLLPAPPMPVAPMPVPVPNIPVPNMPVHPPYGYYPQQTFGHPAVPQYMNINQMMGNYPRRRRPLLGGHRNRFRRPGFTGAGFGANRGPGQHGGLMGRLASRVSQLRLKPQISRREVEEDLKDLYDDTVKDVELIASPRSTILVTEQGLDGITIPINGAHKFSNRKSVDEDLVKDGTQPPILVYKGNKPPVEIYGSKEDIEKPSGQNNVKSNQTTETSSGDNKPKGSKLVDPGESYSDHDDLEYLDVMYSMLPDFIRDTILKRTESETSRWLPVDIPKDTSDDTIGSTENKNISLYLSPMKSLQNSPKETSGESYSAIEADIQELLTLLSIEEQSDLLSKL